MVETQTRDANHFRRQESRLYSSVKKVVSRAKFTEQIFTPQVEKKQLCQLCAQIDFLMRMAKQIMKHRPIFNILRSNYALKVRAGRKLCLFAPAPVQMLFRLNLTDENCSLFRVNKFTEQKIQALKNGETGHISDPAVHVW